MAEAVEIPVQVEGLDRAIRDLQRMNDTVREGAAAGKKELTQIEQMMRRQLSTEILAEGISRVGNAAGGATKNVTDLVSAGIKGFAGGGPWGAAMAVASVGVAALIDKLQEGEIAAAKMAEEAARKTREYADALADVTRQLGEQIELQRVEAELRGQGFSEAEVAAQTPLTLLDEKLLDTRRQIDGLAAEIEAATAESNRILETYGGRQNIANLAGRFRDELAASDATLAALRDRLIALSNSATIQMAAQDAKRTEQARKETATRITAETAAQQKAREERDRAHDAEIMARALRNAAAIEAQEQAEERRRQRRIKRENEAEAAELALRRATREAEAQAEAEASQRSADASNRRAEEERARILDQIEWEANLRREAAAISLAPMDDLKAAATSAFGAVAQGAGQAVASLAMYSAAVRDASEAQSIGAAETVANIATQVQATLAGIAQESLVKALFQGAESIAAFATGNIPGGIAHATAAGKYALIAGGAGIAGAAIGAVRPENTQEREARESKDAAATLDLGGGSSSAGGGRDRGGGPTFILNVGSGVFATRDELGRDMRRLWDAQMRRT